MDEYWKKQLKKDRAGTRIEGAFHKVKEGSLNAKIEIDERRMELHEKLAAILEKHIAEAQYAKDIAQITDYLYENYGFDGLRNEGLREEIREYGEGGAEYRKAERLLETALGLNQARSDSKWGGDLTSVFGGGGDFSIKSSLHYWASKPDALRLAREFLGLKQIPVVEIREARQSALRKNEEGLDSRANAGFGRDALLSALPIEEQEKLLRLPVLDELSEILEPSLAVRSTLQSEPGFLKKRDGKAEFEDVPRPQPFRAVPKSKPTRDQRLPKDDTRGVFNPFDLEASDLKQQARLVEENPVMAKRLIRAVGRNPELFGLA